MSLDKLIRLTIKVDVEPENANLRDTLDYLKALKGAERIELADVEIIGDPHAGEKRDRLGLERNFGKEGIETPPEAPQFLVPPPPPEQEQPDEPEQRKEPVNLLDRIRLR